MALSFSAYTYLIAAATVLTGGLAGFAATVAVRQRRHRLELGLFAGLMLAASVWAVGDLVFVTVGDPATERLGWTLATLGSAFISPFWLAFALAYTDRDLPYPRAIWGLVAVETALYAGLTVFAPSTLQVLGRQETLTGPFGVEFTVLGRTNEPILVAHILVSYVMIVAGTAVILRWLRTERATYRGQAVLLSVGGLAPLAVNAGFLVGLPSPNLNLTSVSFAVSGLGFWVAISRYRLLDAVPVARESVVDRMRDGFVVLDDRDRVVDANPAANRLTPGDDLAVGDRFPDRFPEADSVVAGDEQRTEAVVSDGETRHVEIVGDDVGPTDAGLLDRDGAGRLVVLRDVTDQRQAERRFRRLIEHASDVVAVLDADGTFRYQSPAVESVLGYEPDDLEGESAFAFVHPDDRDRLVAEFTAGMQDPDYTTRVQYRVQDADGDWRVVESIGRNLLDDPVVSGVVVNTRDVTERTERERELRQERERLDRFASVVSHDLRNPLTVAQGYTDMLADELPDDHPGTDYVAEIDASQDRMAAIVDDVLELARDGGDVDGVSPVSVATVAREAWRNVETSGAELEVTATTTVEADRTRLGRVFENLFRNSVEHGSTDATAAADDEASPGDAADTVLTVTVSDDGDCLFAVADDGPGLPDDLREDLFEAGVTGDDNGTGLGLAIVADIVDAHGWTVRAQESDAGGARFVVADTAT